MKSDNGSISKDLLFGFDPKLARAWTKAEGDHHHEHGHNHSHTSELECLSITLSSPHPDASVDLEKLMSLLKTAPKDEVYRIKALLYAKDSPKNSNGTVIPGSAARSRFILNWSFGRWTWSHSDVSAASPSEDLLRMSIFTAQHESNKWTKKIEAGRYICVEDDVGDNTLVVKRVQ